MKLEEQPGRLGGFIVGVTVIDRGPEHGTALMLTVESLRPDLLAKLLHEGLVLQLDNQR